MRFVTFEHEGRTRAGAIITSGGDGREHVLDLSHESFAECLAGVAPDILQMIEAGLSGIVQHLPNPATLAEGATIPRENVRLLAPLPNPPRIIGAAHNYRCALRERGLPLPDAPVLFEKLARTVVGPDDPVILPAGAGGVTYEAELAVVLGRNTHCVSPEEALDHVAGYTLFNDVSASEVIKADGHFGRGKNFSSFGPMGPWLVTPDEFDPAGPRRIFLSIDGETRQAGSISDLVFGVSELISRISQDAPLAPGTVIATGTPAGVAPTQIPPTWLEAGTVMMIQMEGMGRLSNPIVNEDITHGR